MCSVFRIALNSNWTCRIEFVNLDVCDKCAKWLHQSSRVAFGSLYAYCPCTCSCVSDFCVACCVSGAVHLCALLRCMLFNYIQRSLTTLLSLAFCLAL